MTKKIRQVYLEQSDYNKLVARLSGHYLTKYLPDDWNSWPDTEEETKEKYANCVNAKNEIVEDLPFGNGNYSCLTDFMEQNAWEPFEDWSTDDVMSQITGLADEVVRIFKEGLEIEESDISVVDKEIFEYLKDMTERGDEKAKRLLGMLDEVEL